MKQQAKLRGFLNEFPKVPVRFRIPKDIECHANLSAEHLAAHERVAKSILRAALDILDSVKRFPSLESLENAATLLRRTLLSFQADVVSLLLSSSFLLTYSCSTFI